MHCSLYDAHFFYDFNIELRSADQAYWTDMPNITLMICRMFVMSSVKMTSVMASVDLHIF